MVVWWLKIKWCLKKCSGWCVVGFVWRMEFERILEWKVLDVVDVILGA